MHEWLDALLGVKKALTNVSATPIKGVEDSFGHEEPANLEDETPPHINSSQMQFRSKDAVENSATLREARL
jgi:hypothetical protein